MFMHHIWPHFDRKNSHMTWLMMISCWNTASCSTLRALLRLEVATCWYPHVKFLTAPMIMMGMFLKLDSW